MDGHNVLMVYKQEFVKIIKRGAVNFKPESERTYESSLQTEKPSTWFGSVDILLIIVIVVCIFAIVNIL